MVDKLLKACGGVLVLAAFLVVTAQPVLAQNPTDSERTNATAGAASSSKEGDAIARIRDEGMNHSQVMETLSYLTEVIGPRLTGSPNLKRANEWTKNRLECWGLTNAHLEAWGPFGRGWSLKRFSAQVVEPQAIPLISFPAAWSPGLGNPVVADVVYFDANSTSDLDKFKGKLKGAVVLAGAPREVTPRFEPLALRLKETNLLALANAGETRPFQGRFGGGPGIAGGPGGSRSGAGAGGDGPGRGTNSMRGGGGPGSRFAGITRRSPARFLSFLADEGAVAVLSESNSGDGGTLFVAGASLPGGDFRFGTGATNTVRAWSTNAPAILPQITVAAEDYNRLVRMIQQGEKLKMAVDLQVQFHAEDLMAYNTIAEIPGRELKDETVMLGAHMDSWHSGTGATDNGVGVAAVMEAVRILKALDLQPRRTIRVGLWSGEEQGLLGSRAYVSKHFGYYTNPPASTSSAVRSPKDEAEDQPASRRTSTNSTPARKLIKQPEYENFSAYFNLDNGAGKIRGIYLQGNEAVRPLFRRWLEPFRDLEADTITLSNTSGTDHGSYDAVGLPGFQFIQDPLDYWSRTHHSNMDVYDRAPAEDLKQAAVVLAAFAYDAAMEKEKLPRKPAVAQPAGRDF
jgi:hypothetical protein